MKRHKLTASYTVEAAFIVPMTLGLVFTILYLIFIFHDRVILQSNINAALYMVREEKISEEEAEKSFQNSLWMMDIKKGNLEGTNLSFTAEVTAKSDITIPVLSWFMQGVQEISLEERLSRLQPDQVRRYREIKEDKTKKNKPEESGEN